MRRLILVLQVPLPCDMHYVALRQRQSAACFCVAVCLTSL
jgi:hypothetical protein